MIETYEEALAFIHDRMTFKKSDDLRRMNTFMEDLGNPQNNLSIIHVAGTNGKGSTVAFLQKLLTANGSNVGTFTSPFLMRFNERIAINGHPISNSELITIVNMVKPVINHLDTTYPGGGPTEFEIITAMMFCYFSGRVDVAVVEVGIGGLLDPTNILTPAVVVITTIGYDHMWLLGNSLTEITAQKAGIIKPYVPVVVGKLPKKANKIIQQVARRQVSLLYQPGETYQTYMKQSIGWQELFDYEFDNFYLTNIKLQLIGDYQVDNAGCALTAFLLYESQIHRGIMTCTIKRALQETKWPGRFEVLVTDPLIILDGAHNQPAMFELTHLINKRFVDRKIYVLFAVLSDKQFDKMLAVLLQINNVHLVLTSFNNPSHRAVKSPQVLFQHYATNQRVNTIDDWHLGMSQILKTMSMNDVFLITGSLYFISEVRHWFKDHV